MTFILPLLGLLLGFTVVYKLDVAFPLAYANYLAVAVLATLDSVVGGLRAGMNHKFDRVIFLSGFFTNAIAAGLLACFGDQIGVSLTLVATIVFGYRIFQNLSLIRTHWIVGRRQAQALPSDETAVWNADLTWFGRSHGTGAD